MVDIASPLRLPCGVVLPNRLAKAAMTEALADDLGRATPELASLYAQWSDGGSGLLVTGNVQVDRRYVERPGNVCIDGAQDDAARARLAAWARAAKGTGAAAVIAQISHAGRQSNGMVNMAPVGPGDVAMTEMPSGFFGAPHAMTAAEVEEVVARFAHAAKVCAECGFDGVQLHAAHGYLLSSFLNPRANNRASLFGEGDPYHAGELTRRARPLMDAVRAVRAACGPAFCISVKLNSADFQEGGLTADEAREVALALQREGVDLLELTGGNYESGIYFDETSANPASLAEKRQSAGKRESTRLREAYFLEYAVGIRAALDAAAPPTLPLLVTGGWRTARAMRAALASGDCDVIGLGRPLCGDPRGAAKLLDGTLSALPRLEESLHAGPTTWRWLRRAPLKLLRLLPLLGQQSWYYCSILALARTGAPAEGVGPLRAIVQNLAHEFVLARRLRGVACRGSVHAGTFAADEGSAAPRPRRLLASAAALAGVIAIGFALAQSRMLHDYSSSRDVPIV